MKRFGFIPDVEEETDLILGAIGGDFLQDNADWRGFLPVFERQRKRVETQSCVTFATTSIMEMLYKRKYGVEPNYSDRFTSKLSGTTKSGNTPKKVASSVRHDGVIREQFWPFTDIETWEEYFAATPSKLIKKGLSWLGRHSLEYEYVYRRGSIESKRTLLKWALRYSPVGISVFAWVQKDGVYYKPEGARDNHYCVLVAYEGDNPIVWDSYEENLKKLDENYEFTYALRYSLERGEAKKSLWIVDILDRLLDCVCDIFRYEK